MLATIAICAAYTIMGGLWADSISDTVQFVLMCVALAIAIPLAVRWVGGWSFIEHLPMNGANGTREHMAHHGENGCRNLRFKRANAERSQRQ